MTTNDISYKFRTSIIEPLSQNGSRTGHAATSLGKRVCQAGLAAFSGAGNWPFYGVAASFGSRYSKAFGTLLGACEFGAYFAFRIRNFEEIRQKIFDAHTSQRANWKEIATHAGLAALGILAQFPFMVLVYYGNGENLVYPCLSGACEASFTILSLLLTLQASQNVSAEADPQQRLLIEKIDHFLEELPSHYKNPDFTRQIEEIFSDTLPQTEEDRGDELLALVLASQGLPERAKGPWDHTCNNAAKALGLFIACYLTTVNGAVSYQGVKAWKNDQEALAILTTMFVSLANIYLLTKFCIDSAVSSYEALRDLSKHQYRPPLAQAVSPSAWAIGRTLSTAVAWLSFGTTATAGRDYIPKVGNMMMAPAPLSSALLLTENLNWSSDDLLLWAYSRHNPTVKQFAHLNSSLSKFKEHVRNADPEAIRTLLQNRDLEAGRRPATADTPLLR